MDSSYFDTRLLPPVPPSKIRSPHSANQRDHHNNGTETEDHCAGVWTTVITKGGLPPCQRSLHASAIWTNSLYIFGGRCICE